MDTSAGGWPRLARTLSLLLAATTEEIYALAHARGINLPPDSIDTVMLSIDALPEDATSSMQRDIAAGKPSELESQNGAVVRMAQEAGIQVPTHALIYQTLRPLEEKSRAESSR